MWLVRHHVRRQFGDSGVRLIHLQYATDQRIEIVIAITADPMVGMLIRGSDGRPSEQLVCARAALDFVADELVILVISVSSLVYKASI